jgi:ribosomal protein S27AE
MDRQRFGSILSSTAWIILIASWISDFNIYGIDPIWFVLGMWILRGPVLNMLYGPLPRRTIATQGAPGVIGQAPINSDNPLCPSCGRAGLKNDKFCQDCGAVLEQPNTQYEGFN